MLKEVIQQLIIDFHKSDIPLPAYRDIDIPKLGKNLRKGIVFIGMRRSGKTYAMYQHMHQLLNKGHKKEKLVYLNFEDDRLISLTHKDFQSILDAYFELYPEFIDSEDIVFYFDEIHEIDGWEKFIRRLIDKEKVKIFISGSSSKMLSKEIASCLRGRTINIEVFPFSFTEYLRFLKLPLNSIRSTKTINQIIHAFNNFLIYGGFPERFSIETSFFNRLLQGYIDIVIYRDIIERYNIKNAHIVRETLTFCLQNCSSLVNVLNIYNRFKTMGKVIGKNSIYEYMTYFEDTYCIFALPIFSYSQAQKSLNPKKIFTIDQGLITAYSIKPKFEEAMRFENTIFSALRRKYENIFYFKTRNAREIDFVVDKGKGELALYQACQSLSNESTAKREYTSLLEAMKELNCKQGTILTLNETECVHYQSEKRIKVKPLWKWLIETENV